MDSREINFLELQKLEKDNLNLFYSFLKFIDSYPNKVQYARIQVLNWDEEPLDNGQIQGRVTNGSLNISGSSAIRRSGSLGLIVAETDTFYKVEDIENIFSLNKKIKIEIGIDLNILPPGELAKYRNYTRIWFPLGIFVVKNPSLNRSVSGVTLSLTLSDKMCLLNGEMGGKLPAATIFSEADVLDTDGNYIKEYFLIKDIIRTLIEQYGGIKKYKISDINDTAFKIMKWGGNNILYKYKYNNSYFLDTSVPAATIVEKGYNVGDNIGMTVVPFTWPGAALSANIGETITSVLDKLKTLGDYEYFFDIDGTFVWQKKQTYAYQGLTSVSNEQFFADEIQDIFPTEINKEVKYYFISKASKNCPENTAKNLVISYSNSPQYNNIKNDYIIWGKRKNKSGSEVLIRYHIAFGLVPQYDQNIDTTVYYYTYPITSDICSFQVVKDGGAYTESQSPEKNTFYTSDCNKYIYDFNLNKYVKKEIKTKEFSAYDNWRTLLYFRGKREEANGVTQTYFNSPFFKDLEIEWPKLYDMENNNWRSTEELPVGDTIDYFCHIIDVSQQGSQLNKEQVGRYMTKTLNDSNINCIYFPDIDNTLILKKNDEIPEDMLAKYTVIRVDDDIYNQIYTGGSQNSAFEQARQLICQNTSYANTISISCIPIYYLDPNTTIYVEDEESGIKGYYVINTISLPLTYNGNMNISASKAITIQ